MSKMDAESSTLGSAAALILDGRLAKSTLFQEKDPHGVLTEWVEPAAAQAVYGFAFTFAGLGQVLVGILEFQRKNVFASNAFLCYGFFWLGTALNGTLQGAGIWTPTVKGAQMAHALWGCITIFFWLQTFILNVALCALFLSLAILFFLLSAAQTHPGITKATGGWGVMVAIISFYIGVAILFIEMYGKEILPVGTFNWNAMKRRFGPVGTKRWSTNADATNV
ncbi:hypothetical protein N2152v2_003381 [Parachlorella kessleri]